MVRFLAECFPILPGPRWLHNRAQPIASENVIDYLVAGLEQPAARGGIYEMGGPEQMQFGEVMLRYARHRGLRRILLTIPGIPIWWMAQVVDRLTPVPRPIATALIGGLQSDSRVMDEAARQMFPKIQLLTFEQAVHAAQGELSPERLERVWEGLSGNVANFRHEGFIVDYRTRSVRATSAAVFAYLASMGGSNGWPFASRLWRLRGWIDSFFGQRDPHGNAISRGVGNSQREPDGAGNTDLKPGDLRDFYRVEAIEPGRLIRMRSLLHAPGDGWLEWRVDPQGKTEARLAQTAFFAPRGLPGFLYWLVLGPLHQAVLNGLIDAIRKRSEAT